MHHSSLKFCLFVRTLPLRCVFIAASKPTNMLTKFYLRTFACDSRTSLRIKKEKSKLTKMQAKARVVGVGFTQLGKLMRPVPSLMGEALERALQSCKIPLRHVEGLITGISLAEPRFMTAHFFGTYCGLLPSKRAVIKTMVRAHFRQFLNIAFSCCRTLVALLPSPPCWKHQI
jgi:hypothetical protein